MKMNVLLATILAAAALSARAQTQPQLSFSVDAAGTLTVTWPVQRVYPRIPALVPTYQIETAPVLGQWRTAGEPFSGAAFPTGPATIQIPGLRETPASFVRVRATLDFADTIFIRTVMTNAVLPNATFAGADLFASNLTDSDIHGADFSAVDLRSGRLQRVNARGTDFTLARLASANCENADFTGANFLFAELSDAVLSVANFEGADLRGAVIEEATITHTRFHGSQTDALTVMSPRIRAVWEIVNGQGAGKNYSAIDLTFTDLSGGDVSNGMLRSDLSGADMQRMNLNGTDLTGANLRLTDLRGVQMDERTIIHTKWRTVADILNNPRAGRAHQFEDLSVAFWIRPNFEQADLRGTHFEFGLMFEPNLFGASAASAIFSSVQFLGGDFQNADLRNANFTNAQIENANFRGANMTGAILNGVIFRNTIMPDGTLRN